MSGRRTSKGLAQSPQVHERGDGIGVERALGSLTKQH
jgi:hypothetical protein